MLIPNMFTYCVYQQCQFCSLMLLFFKIRNVILFSIMTTFKENLPFQQAFNCWLQIPDEKLKLIGEVTQMLHNASLLQVLNTRQFIYACTKRDHYSKAQMILGIKQKYNFFSFSCIKRYFAYQSCFNHTMNIKHAVINRASS